VLWRLVGCNYAASAWPIACTVSNYCIYELFVGRVDHILSDGVGKKSLVGQKGSQFVDCLCFAYEFKPCFF